MKAVVLKAGALLALLAAAAPGRPALDEAPRDARTAYRQHCGGCHLERGFGTLRLARRMPQEHAQLEHRPDLSEEFVRIVVRRGLGSMPPIRRSELDDRTLAAIAAYLEKPR